MAIVDCIVVVQLSVQYAVQFKRLGRTLQCFVTLFASN